MNTRAFVVVLIKFLALLPGTKLLTIEFCLKNMTKHFYCFALFCFFVIFSFSYLIVLVMLVKVLVGIFPSLCEV